MKEFQVTCVVEELNPYRTTYCCDATDAAEVKALVLLNYPAMKDAEITVAEVPQP